MKMSACGQQPLREHDFLLIAAGKHDDFLPRARCFDPQRCDEAPSCADPRGWRHQFRAGTSRSGAASITLSATDSSSTSPCCFRSSGNSAIRRLTAWLGLPIAPDVHRSRSAPASIGSMPKIARAGSDRPAPTSPARPTISPRRTSKRDIVQHAVAVKTRDLERNRTNRKDLLWGTAASAPARPSAGSIRAAVAGHRQCRDPLAVAEHGHAVAGPRRVLEVV